MLRQDDKELLLAALTLFREQLVRDAGKELTYAEGSQGSQKAAHEKQASELIKKASNVVYLHEKVLRTIATKPTPI